MENTFRRDANFPIPREYCITLSLHISRKIFNFIIHFCTTLQLAIQIEKDTVSAKQHSLEFQRNKESSHLNEEMHFTETKDKLTKVT